MNDPYSTPVSDPDNGGARTGPGKIAKGFAITAALSNFAAAIFFIPFLAGFGPRSSDLGMALDPLMRALTMGRGVFPALVFCAAGIFAFASCFTRRSGMVLTATITGFLISAAAVLVIPQLCYAALAEIIRNAPAAP